MSASSQPVIAVRELSYRFGKKVVLDDIAFDVPQGAFYAMLGANGAGKTTLFQLLASARPMQHGSAQLFGTPVRSLSMAQRQRVSYVAEGQELPKWMRLEQMEAFCAPLYPAWDTELARTLRTQFDLDARQTIGTMSRGQRMKAALLCALASRPKLIVMDEPFTGMDVAVKDELVRGLLDAATLEGTTVLLCSHDIAEIEALADWVGFLDHGTIRMSESLDALRARYKRVELVTEPGLRLPTQLPASWLSVERAGLRLSVLMEQGGDERETIVEMRGVTRRDVREASLKELYLALCGPPRGLVEAAI